MGILTLQDVRLSLGGKAILDGLSLDFWEGHIHALVGPNGAGKSTTANLIMGLAGYTDFAGDLLYQGRSIKGMPLHERARAGITLAWQEPARFEGLGVEAFIRASAADRSVEKACEVLERVGLNPDAYLQRKVDKTLSGGERKRVEVAAILAMEPKVVLLDEPDSGIDVEALERIFEALAAFRERKTTVVMITHSPTVLQHAEHAFLLCRGRLYTKGTVETIAPYFAEKCLACDPDDPPEDCDSKEATP